MQSQERAVDRRSRSTAPGSSIISCRSRGSAPSGRLAAAPDPAPQPVPDTASERARSAYPLIRTLSHDNTGPVDIAGVIEKLELTNFMCHSSLALEFNPRINFIVGKNGSGKSAIMTAVMVVLGTKAVDTCRGKSLASFVKLGARQAKIVIYLVNKGRYAYQPERYGESIILTKIIYINGSSKTLIRIIPEKENDIEGDALKENKNKLGNKSVPKAEFNPQSPEKEVRQVLKPELENIMTALKITLPNPFAVMTQETMKTFVGRDNEEEMYELLKEGTGIQEAIRIHQGLKDKLDGMTTERNILKKELETIEQEYSVQMEKKNLLMKVQKAQESIKNLQNEMMWSTVVGEEAALKVLQNQLQKHLNQKRDRENELRKIIEQEETARMELKQLESETQKWKSQMDAKRGERTELKEVFETSGSGVETATRELQSKEHQLQVARADFKVLQQGIAKMNKHSMAEEISRRAKQKQEVARLQQELCDLSATKESISLDLVRLNDEFRHNKAAVNEKKAEFNAFKSRYQIERSELDQSKKQAGTLPTVYGPRMSELLKAIDKAYEQGKFTEKPIGPIGLHVQVKDPKWELAVESFLKSEFRNFFCDTNEDRLVLTNLCKKVIPNYNLVTVVSKFVKKVHNVKKYKSPSKGDLVNFMDILDVAKPEVMNYLIDQKGIESILLCATTEKALTLMGNLKTVPQNCNQMITGDGEQIYPAPLFRYYCSEISKIQYLVKSKEESVETAECKLAEDVKKMAKLEDELTQLHRTTQKIKTELTKTNRLSKNAEDKEMDLRRRIDTSREEEHEVSQDAFASLQEEIEISEGKIRELENDRKCLLEKLKVAKAERSRNESLLEALVPDFRTLKYNIDSCQDRKTNLESQLSADGTKEVYMHKKIEEMGEKEAKLQRDVEVQETAVREAEAIASQSCPRVNTKRSAIAVKKEIQKVAAFVGSLSNNLEDSHEVLERIAELEKLKFTRMTSVDKVEISHGELCVALHQRKSHYNNKIVMIFLQIAEMFRLFFDQQPFEGCLVFSHFNRQMKIKVYPKGRPEMELRNPSGGERTYTTIALILSVWERLRFPFFMLDEFDVFLDVWNRRLSSDLMIHMARERKRNQFIFLTPLTLDQAACPDITIFRLDDPRPSNLTGNDREELES